jgi:hypothetical protein
MKIKLKNEKYKVIEFNKTKKEFICINKTCKLNEVDSSVVAHSWLQS